MERVACLTIYDRGKGKKRGGDPCLKRGIISHRIAGEEGALARVTRGKGKGKGRKRTTKKGEPPSYLGGGNPSYLRELGRGTHDFASAAVRRSANSRREERRAGGSRLREGEGMKDRQPYTIGNRSLLGGVPAGGREGGTLLQA